MDDPKDFFVNNSLYDRLMFRYANININYKYRVWFRRFAAIRVMQCGIIPSNPKMDRFCFFPLRMQPKHRLDRDNSGIFCAPQTLAGLYTSVFVLRYPQRHNAHVSLPP